MAWVHARLCKLQKEKCTRLAAASDSLPVACPYGRWFSQGTPASSTTKTGRHDIGESGIKHHKSNQIMIMIIAMFNGIEVAKFFRGRSYFTEDQETCRENNNFLINEPFKYK